MDIVVIGATGFVGGAIARRFLADGHAVRGLSRTDSSAQTLARQGIQPLPGDLTEGRDALIRAVADHDAVVVAAQLDPDMESDVTNALLDATEGSEKTLLFTSGSGVLLQRTEGAWSPDSFAEDDEFTTEPLAQTRKAVEDIVRSSDRRGVRGIVIRPGTIWGPGDHGHVSMVYQSVATLGAAGYVGQGLNVYSHVHIDDVTHLFSLALHHGISGALYHAVVGETPMRWVAESVAADLQVPVRSLDMKEAEEVWGKFGALIASASSRIRPERSTTELGWAPRKFDMLATIGDSRLRRLAEPGH